MTFEYGLYSPRESMLHRLDPRAKMIWAMMVLAFSIYNGNYLLSPLHGVIVYASVVGGLLASRPPTFWPKLVGGLTAVVLFFSIVFWPASTPQKGEIILVIPVLGWSYTDSALRLALSKAFLVLNPVIAIIIIFTTSKPGALFQALVRWKIPYKVAYIPILALRFLPTTINEVRTIIDAQESRALNLRKGSLVERLRKHVAIFIPLLIRMMKSAVELGVALDSKGFGFSRQRTFSRALRWERRDTIFLISGGLIYGLTLTLCMLR